MAEDEPVEIYIEKKMVTDINKVKGLNTEKGIFDTDSTIMTDKKRQKK